MPQYPENDVTGDIGVDLVSLQIKRAFSWVFREQMKNDLGIDGHIEIVNEEREGTGRLIAVQIKTGASYLKHESDEGFKYYGEAKHLKYWLLHSLPVLVILCDEKSEVCYWVEISRSNVNRTKSGWNVLVPKKQVLTERFKKDLLSIAGMPQHGDIIQLALFRFLGEKYHRDSMFGRLDICPLLHEPHDFMYFTCLGQMERDETYVYVAHHHDIYQEFSSEVLEKFISWRELNIKLCGHSNPSPKLFVYAISEDKGALKAVRDKFGIGKTPPGVEVFTLYYSYMNMVSPEDGRFYHLAEIDETGEEVYFY